MKREPTAEQALAIRTEGRDVCVVAGAGSGKTFVLTERVVHRVLRGNARGETVPLSQVLAITFTEKAAAEMKQRLAEALEAATGRSARADVERAAISTIHAFCARMLREFAVEAGVDPGFAVLDEVESDRRRREALERLVEETAHKDPAAFETLATLGGDEPAESLLAVWTLARESGGPVGDFVRRAAEVPTVEGSLGMLRRALDHAAGLIDRAPAASAEKARRVIAAARGLPGDDATPEAIEAALVPLLDSIDLRCSKEMAAALREVREFGGAALSIAAEHALKPLRERLAEAVERLEAFYEETKGDGAELDFADLERRALALLTDREDVKAAVRGRWPEVLVDEFQDVNPLQAKLLALVETPGRAFVVGDPKQSIYGFRGADFTVFKDRLERMRASDPAGVVEMRTSFRSRPDVLAAVSAVFPAGVGGAGDAALVAGRTWVPAGEPVVEVAALSCKNLAEGRPAEMAWIAARIAALVEGDAERGVAPARVASPKPDDALATRPCGFGDIAVLLRATTHVKALEAALVARDIPYAVVKGRGFFVAREVVDLANLLAVVDDPRDDLTLAAVLRSPACGLSEDGLFVLCAARGEPPKENRHGPPPRSLSDVVLASPLPPEVALDADDAAALARFAAVLADLRLRRAHEGVADLVERALAATRLATLALGRPNGRQRAANLRKVRDLARGADAAGRSLAEFVAEVADLREREVREAEAVTAAQGAVTIMTIHASKGLEFPVVFVPDLGRMERGERSEVVADARLGTGLRRRAGQPHDAAPWAHQRIVEARAAADAAEGERLLYVAMTRAAERLVLSAALPERNGARPWWALVSAAVGGKTVGGGTAGDENGAGDDDAPGAGAASDEDRVVSLPGADVRVAGTASLRRAGAGAAGAPRTLLGRAARHLAAGVVPEIALREDAVADAARLVAEASRRAPDEDGTPYQATVSALVAFDRCPQEYRLRHVIGVPESLDLRLGGPGSAFDPAMREAPREERPGDDEDETELSARAVGRAAHAALEELVPAFGTSAREAVRAALTAETSGAPPDPASIDRVTRWVEGFRDGELGRAVAGVERRSVRREQAFLLRAGRTVVRGQIDLVWRGPEGTVVVDYKTSASEEPRREHRLQMGLYALAMRGVEGRLPARLALWSLPRAAALDVPFGEEQAAALEGTLLAEFADRTARRDFTPRPAPPCRFCTFRDRCGFSQIAP